MGKKMEQGKGRREGEKGSGRELWVFSDFSQLPRITAGTVTVRVAVNSQIAW